MDFEKLAEEISARVREAVAEAEERAQQIVADAEARAKQAVESAEREAAAIRDRAESDARDRLVEVRSALDRLESSITGEQPAVTEALQETKAAAEAAAPKSPRRRLSLRAQKDTPAAQDQATEVLADDDPDALEESEIEQDEKAADDLPEAEVTGEGTIDEAGARLVAMEMALDGEDVEAIATRLTEEFGLVEAQEIATEVHGRAAP